ncbi:MAG: hypothetical protein QNI87_08325 [Erythrobacter sp.]|uniref:hypothetical protein n=1 Tax=Erythrobacter sp. TaxID=1042 RepID=UPI0026291E65|nr:hypothetical protein [Erythrobacter sp.]MDJ0978530.1 hypothetical protein [Erythrobacter sp.]
MRKALTLLAALGVSACSTGLIPPPKAPSQAPRASAPVPDPVPAPRTAPQTAPPTRAAPAFRSPQVQRGGDLDAVIGANASALTRRFGAARIDLAEGDARKLQFTGRACVLDIFLYPLSPGAEPVATHVEARSRRDGSDTDRARCIRDVEAER